MIDLLSCESWCQNLGCRILGIWRLIIKVVALICDHVDIIIGGQIGCWQFWVDVTFYTCPKWKGNFSTSPYLLGDCWKLKCGNLWVFFVFSSIGQCSFSIFLFYSFSNYLSLFILFWYFSFVFNSLSPFFFSRTNIFFRYQ